MEKHSIYFLEMNSKPITLVIENQLKLNHSIPKKSIEHQPI